MHFLLFIVLLIAHSAVQDRSLSIPCRTEDDTARELARTQKNNMFPPNEKPLNVSVKLKFEQITAVEYGTTPVGKVALLELKLIKYSPSQFVVHLVVHWNDQRASFERMRLCGTNISVIHFAHKFWTPRLHVVNKLKLTKLYEAMHIFSCVFAKKTPWKDHSGIEPETSRV